MAHNDLEFVAHDVLVHYKRRAAKLDRQHLIVMFAGIGPLDSYEFDGRASSDSQAHWLWIKDKFDGQHAYYLCRGMDFGIEAAVVSLIDSELDRLGLTRNECTLVGFSKGGFAALYLGIKYNFRNIVASAPQLYVGSHTHGNRPKIFAHMTGNGGDAERELLDRLIPDAVASDVHRDQNIYLFSSRQDQFHEQQVEPALPMFSRYRNFNYIETDSDLVNEHTDVTRYNVPLILATLYALAENVPPSYGTVRNGNRMSPGTAHRILGRQRSSGESVASLDSGILKGSLLYPEGVGLRRGHPARDSPAAKLVLADGRTRYEFALATRADHGITYRYYEGAFCDYRQAKFTSPQKAGIDLSALPPGTYRLGLQLHGQQGTAEVTLSSRAALRSESVQDGRLYRLHAAGDRVLLDVRPAVGRSPKAAVFRLRKSWARGPLLHLDGDFAVHGLEMPNRKTGTYYLVLRSDERTYIRTLECSSLEGPSDLFGDGLADYSAAHFDTRRRRGLDVSDLEPGQYDVAVTLSYAGTLHTHRAGKTLRIQAGADGEISASIRDSSYRPRGLPRIRRAELGRITRRIKRRVARLLPS